MELFNNMMHEYILGFIFISLSFLLLIYYFILKPKSKTKKPNLIGTASNIEEADDDHFITVNDLKEVINAHNENNRPIMIYFSMKHCPGCRLLSPVLDEIMKEYQEKITFLSYSTETHYDTIVSLNIKYFPSLFILDKDLDLVFNSLGVENGDQKTASFKIKTKINQLLTT